MKSPIRRAMVEKEIMDTLCALDDAICGLRRGTFPKDRDVVADRLSVVREFLSTSQGFAKKIMRRNDLRSREIKREMYDDVFRNGHYKKGR